MKKLSLFILLVALSSISFYACTHKADNPAPANGGNTGGGNTGGGNTGGGNTGGGNTGGGTVIDTSLCFERDILPIFVSNCAKSGCHDAASHEEGFVFTSWQTITSKEFKPWDAEDTELYEKITEHDPDDIMPPPPNAPLTPAQIALIREWINRGAPNTTNCATACDSTRFTYAATIKPMLDTYCKGCHNANVTNAGLSYENHSTTVAAVNSGRFLGAINHQAGYSPMPKGGSKLNDCQIQQIQKWIAAGTPNN
ncbi:MAG: hypothetical protein EOP49_09990 [Sphingobacteriales bacterium]|nr:MAG: hypothetical protein EOP49_09990 [Sphingobacteriales bacterium]